MKDRGGDLDNSNDSIGQYQSFQAFQNNLEQSISLTERSAKRLLPIYRELHKKLIPMKKLPKTVGSVTMNEEEMMELDEYDDLKDDNDKEELPEDSNIE